MLLGVTIPNVHETLAEAGTITALARRAEALGLDSVWVNDHVVIPSPAASAGTEREPAYAARYGEQRGQLLLEPLITLAYLAGATERIALGVSVYLLALRHPLLAAKQVVSLDALSGGRAILGVGVGWLEAEYEAVGVPFRQRGARTDDALEILKALCADDRATFEGRHHGVRDVEFLPKPVQLPHPPLWIGGRSEAAMRRAARLGDAWHPSHLTGEELRRVVPELHRACEAAGRAPGDVGVTTRRRLLRDGEASESEADRVLHGGPGRIAATIAELEEIGVTHLVVELPGATEQELLESLDWFGQEVLARA
jgi:probable F420-dependent oxidoreductase